MRNAHSAIFVIPGTLLVLAAAPTPGRAVTRFVDPVTLEDELYTLLNAQRAANGVPAIRRDGRIVAAARGHSQDMMIHHDLDHTGSDGSEPNQRMVREGYQPVVMWGEVLAGWDQDMEGLVAAWMQSADHRPHILNRATPDGGAGVVIAGDGIVWVTFDFARTQSSPPPSPGVPKPPSALSGVASKRGQHRIRLTWNDNSNNETGFTLVRVSPNRVFRLGPNTTLFRDEGLSANTTYTYQLSAFNASGSSPTITTTCRAK